MGQIIGSTSASGTSVSIPAHQAGDVILIWAYRDGATTVPTTPAAGSGVPTWLDIDSAAGANLNSAACKYCVATGSGTLSGTWTNATGMSVIVIRGADSTPIGAHSQTGSAASGSAGPTTAITQQINDGSSVIVDFFGHRNVTAWSAAPAGYTQQSQVATETCCITKNDSTNDGAAVTQTCTTSASGGYRAQAVEVRMIPMASKRGSVVGQAVQRAATR